ncbi:MAG: response regulator [Myxococcales bacterium]|nr:response regulator [Myxococcales bacterium]
MGGFEVARRVKGDERNARLPICFLTASDVDGSDIKDAYEAGAADFLAKPVQPWLLRARVSVFVTLWQQAQALQDRLRLELENAEWKLSDARLIAQNERVERSLSDSTAVFASMAEAYCTLEVVCDENEQPSGLRFLGVNRAFEARSGLESPIGKLMFELAADLERQTLEACSAVAASGGSKRFEGPAAIAGVWDTFFAFVFEGSGPRRVGLLMADISARKEGEAAMQAQNAFLYSRSGARSPPLS